MPEVSDDQRKNSARPHVLLATTPTLPCRLRAVRYPNLRTTKSFSGVDF